WCCANKGVGCPELQCIGKDDWQQSWSSGKKAWCCQHHAVGCPKVSALPAAAVPELHTVEPSSHKVTPQTKTMDQKSKPGAAAAPAGASGSEKYDCTKGGHNPLQGWSDKQQDWCCWNYGKGCPENV
ncbi:unnamed protein product, partial [Polarella glacialis]